MSVEISVSVNMTHPVSDLRREPSMTSTSLFTISTSCCLRIWSLSYDTFNGSRVSRVYLFFVASDIYHLVFCYSGLWGRSSHNYRLKRSCSSRARFSGKIPQAPRGAEDFSTKPEGPDLARLIRTRTTFACGYGNSASI